MRKSKDITKYDIDWQVLRATVKGGKTDVISKLSKVRDYWNDNQSMDNWERVVNWLEGLRMGYIASKNQQAMDLIDKEIEFYKQNTVSNKEDILSDQEHIARMMKYDFKTRYGLWRDLFKRNEKWLAKGYNHKEHNHFMDLMWEVFKKNNEESNLKENYSFEKLSALRDEAEGLDNTHKFFF
jgi:hypothetical protein